jgi:hypothetical protein
MSGRLQQPFDVGIGIVRKGLGKRAAERISYISYTMIDICLLAMVLLKGIYVLQRKYMPNNTRYISP